MNPNETDNIREQRRLLAEQIARIDRARTDAQKFYRGLEIRSVIRDCGTHSEALCITRITPTDDGIVIEVK